MNEHLEFEVAEGHDFAPFDNNLENCRRCGAHRGNHTFPFHPFVGRLDRPCEVCSAPDRAQVHSGGGQLIHGWNCMVRYKTWAARDPERHCDCGVMQRRAETVPHLFQSAFVKVGYDGPPPCAACGRLASHPIHAPRMPQDAPERSIPIETTEPEGTDVTDLLTRYAGSTWKGWPDFTSGYLVLSMEPTGGFNVLMVVDSEDTARAYVDGLRRGYDKFKSSLWGQLLGPAMFEAAERFPKVYLVIGPVNVSRL